MPQLVTITGGGFQDSSGNLLANGYLRAQLQQDIVEGLAQIGAGPIVKLQLDANGDVTGAQLWGPATYHLRAYSAGGQHVWAAYVTVPDVTTYSLTPS